MARSTTAPSKKLSLVASTHKCAGDMQCKCRGGVNPKKWGGPKQASFTLLGFQLVSNGLLRGIFLPCIARN